MNAMLPLPNSQVASSLGTGAADADVEAARAMVQRLHAAGRRSTAEMLQELRRAFPHAPLSARVRALEALRAR
jgi:hypothetical protein